MQFVLVRHGIAVDHDDPDCPAEPLRFLTAEGIRRTREAMAGLAVLGIRPDALLSSPYVRALETARLAAEALGFDAKNIASTDALLPGAAPREILRQLAGLQAETVVCCGHAPNLDAVIAHAVGARHAFTSLKKAGAACLEMASARAAHATLVWLQVPTALRRMRG